MNAAREQDLADVAIRRLSYSDVPAIMEIERTAFATPWKAATFDGLIARSDSDVLGAVRLGHLVGYSVIWTIGDQSELGNVAVREQERGLGIGRRLIDAALQRAESRGSRECFLEVRESNVSARTLYESCGFRAVGRRRNYYSKPTEDALVMRLDFH